jgi:hypothetical protein
LPFILLLAQSRLHLSIRLTIIFLLLTSNYLLFTIIILPFHLTTGYFFTTIILSFSLVLSFLLSPHIARLTTDYLFTNIVLPCSITLGSFLSHPIAHSIGLTGHHHLFVILSIGSCA